MAVEKKLEIEAQVKAFKNGKLFENSIALFNSLGYKTERQNRLPDNTYHGFLDTFEFASSRINPNKILNEKWERIELLFQLTQHEMTRQSYLFNKDRIDDTIIEAYLFFAIELKDEEYKRSHLSDITREINKVFLMPVMILFKYGNKLTLSVIKRRLHRRDESKDVLEKVTLIRDIDIIDPHPAHILILYDLSFEKLQRDFEFRNFVELHNAWQKTLDSSELNKRFYRELANWYFWAVENVEYPDDAEKDRDKRNSVNVIRLLTRLIFVWFLKEKSNLIPLELFNKKKLDKILDYKDKTGSTYYKAILQNLFFAVLNTEMNKDVQGSRTFIKRQYGIQDFYRYERFFKDKEAALKLFEDIPFLNGGLFENLDTNVGEPNEKRIDCFSNRRENEERLKVPDYLFFSGEQPYDDLNAIYDTKNKKYFVRGLIEILNKYKFTIHENTPIEEEIALDPELLGKVFENLLASYVEETKTTARKLTGSFYTPREIVDYMVEESLIYYLFTKLDQNRLISNKDKTEKLLRHLLSYTEENHKFNEIESNVIIEAIDHCKILDPACGSGAFPMGILHKMVFILSKLDPDNKKWKQRQIDKIYELPDHTLHEHLKDEIEKTFNENYDDYGRKLYLIENCIYGVDIQPIAVQISKLRFFISLIVDQKVNRKAWNLGIRALPNLETKFVAANSLIGISKPTQMFLRNEAIDEMEFELKQIRERHFSARTPATKQKYREKDKALRSELAKLLVRDGFNPRETKLMAEWNPYDQNKNAKFFDPEWMFGLQQGFVVIVANPPYRRIYSNDNYIDYYKSKYKCAKGGKINTYKLFFEKGLELLKTNGTLSYITPYNYLTSGDSIKLREMLITESSIKKIIDYEESEKVFESSTQAVATIVLQKSSMKSYNFDYVKKGIIYGLSSIEILKDKNILIKGTNDTIQRINEYTLRFDDIIYGWQGEINVSTKKKSFTSIQRKGFLPLVRGNHIGYYNLNTEPNEYCPINISSRDHYKYKRIVFQEVSNSGQQRRIKATILQEVLCGHTTNYLINKKGLELESILGLLNSKLINYYFKFYNQTNHVPIGEIKKIPIPKLFLSHNQIISNLVKIVLEIGENQSFMKKFFIDLIDAVVYELYFENSVKELNSNVISFIQDDAHFHLFDINNQSEKLKKIELLYKKLNLSGNEIRNRILKQNIAVEEIKTINKSLSQ